MKKDRGVDKKPRARNLKGLSIFDDEIAAPADYGDFMKIDAPVSLRVSSHDEKSVTVAALAPHWGKFIGGDGTQTAPSHVSDQTQAKLRLSGLVEPESPELCEAQVLVPATTEILIPAVALAPIETSAEVLIEVDIKEQNDAPLLLAETHLPVAQDGRVHAVQAPVFLDVPKAAEETAYKLPTSAPLRFESEPRQSELPTKAIKAVPPKVALPRIQLKTSGYEKITLSYGFGSLVGVQRRIVIFIFEDCVRGGKSETTPLTTEHLCQTLGLTYKTTRGSVWRLQQKNFLEVAASKEGRGGWVIYRLNREIYSELLLLRNSNQLLDHDIGIGAGISSAPPEAAAQISPRTGPAVAEDTSNLDAEWEAIDFSGIGGIGFTKYHLKQLVIQKKNKLTPAEVQDSINFFAFDLKRNNKRAEIMGDPVNYFMGIVRNGHPYTPPTNYKSAEEESRLSYLEYLKRKDTERLEQESKIRNFEFMNWKATADLTEVIKAAPEYTRGKPGPLLDAYLDGHFSQHVWPTLSNKFAPNSDERTQIAQEIQESLRSL